MPQSSEIERMRAVSNLVGKLQATYHDAKRFKADIYFEFVESSLTDQKDELCPKVSIEIER